MTLNELPFDTVRKELRRRAAAAEEHRVQVLADAIARSYTNGTLQALSRAENDAEEAEHALAMHELLLADPFYGSW